MTEMGMVPIVVAGAGIGGLSAALAQKGFEVRVYERATEIREIGEGIQLGPNAFEAFTSVGHIRSHGSQCL
jgi:salicylate hydroxylase